MINILAIKEFLEFNYGLDIVLDSKNTADGQLITILPSGIEPHRAFEITVLMKWRSMEFNFSIGSYASALLEEIRNCSERQKAIYKLFIDSILKNKGEIKVHDLSENIKTDDPSTWTRLSTERIITFRKVGLVLEQDVDSDTETSMPWISRFYGAVFSILPLEEPDDEDDTGHKEGSVYHSLTTRYERNRLNRAACIDHYGTVCQICGFDFKDIYGEIGAGYIQVHHKIPVSQLGSDYIINPIKDLIPVCANCHAMLHTEDPPIRPEVLRQILKK